MTAGALSGIRVLDLSRLLPGPYCSMILADHGAEVIAVEDRRFRGDGLYFSEINRNKRHITLNLKTDAGRDIFQRLARRADVVIEGFRPGVVERLGVDYARVREINPRVIYCAITGYGQSGPLRDRAGHDVNYLATAGALDLIGTADAPVVPGVQIADILGGGMQAAVGILLALFARERGGEGQYIDISVTDGLLGLLHLPRYFAESRGERLRRSAMTLSHRYACYNIYRTADQRHLAVGAVENRFWKKLCEHLGAPQYVPLQYDDEHRHEIIQWLQGVIATKPLAQWEAELGHLDACCCRVATMDEVFTSPLFAAREMVCEQRQADGNDKMTLGIPVKLEKTPGSLRTPPPGFGESTGEVLMELGFSEAEVEAFVEEGIV